MSRDRDGAATGKSPSDVAPHVQGGRGCMNAMCTMRMETLSAFMHCFVETTGPKLVQITLCLVSFLFALLLSDICISRGLER